eukprot:TRINITY_DN5230_c0_g1_i1.p1 TRINITY_DN5230_c0_g1~~TRINITY_DN5230_c0_g1_i1.p1  ORF type:complete len:94 (-),score=12.95 TRINITY_DN5230_c0_g1_i1:153-401(-)
MTGSGFIGEDYKFDNYFSRVERHGYWADIDVMVESGTTNTPIERIERGGGHTHYFHERQSFFDMSEAAIPADHFKVPGECPK